MKWQLEDKTEGIVDERGRSGYETATIQECQKQMDRTPEIM